jgi:hypothetical protein
MCVCVFQLLIVSDSPSSQYRNKNVIYLLKETCREVGIQPFDWIYTEVGHGKSALDGVRAAVKRQADTYVSHGGSIRNASDIVELLTKSKIQYVYEVIYLLKILATISKVEFMCIVDLL